MEVGPARPTSLSPESEQLLMMLARRIRRARLAPVAVLYLESVRPLAFLGGQLLTALAPLVSALLPVDRFEEIARLLEDRAHLDRLLALLEQPNLPTSETRP